MMPLIAIVGRPNVGKSTLFNKLIGLRYAITSDVAGTTRDRIYHEADFGSYRATLVDTGGLTFATAGSSIEADVQAQARIAVEEADVIFFLIDGTECLTADDTAAAQLLRRSHKPLLFIANKADTKKMQHLLPEFFEIGLGEPLQVSAIHSLGLSELRIATEKLLKKQGFKPQKQLKKHPTRVAIIGRPNVGKSSLVNALLGSNRLIVSDQPGTTIDATDTEIRYENSHFTLIDTAGLRRRGKRAGIERLGALRTIRAIARSDIGCLVMDFEEGITVQDLHACEYILDSGKGLIVVVNKSDLMKDPEEDRKKFLDALAYRMPFASFAPVLFVSAVEKKNIFKILSLSKSIREERMKKLPPREFDLFIRTAAYAHPPMRSGRKIIIKGGNQTGTEPPSFTIRCNLPDLIHFSYRRYLENEIRRKYGFYGTVIKIDVV